MRIRRLDLVRFGKFTDQRIEFPSADPDLHMIVGANEAGKSTVRAALADLLFGIGARSTFNFRHAYETMCLGAILERGTDRLEFRRLKKNKDALRDASDQPLPAERLEPFLGRADRNFFERMFALDRRALEDGGVEILQAKNDLGRMLFEASAGLAGLAPIRQQLEEEAAGLWDKRHSQKRAFSRAAEALEAAKQRLRAVTVRTRDWQEAQQKLAAAETKLAEAIAEYSRLETERDRLERIRRVAPHVRKRSDLMAERDDLGAVALLPAAAGTQLAAAQSTIALAETDIARQEALIDKARTERDRISVDHGVLGRRAEIVHLAEQHARVQNHPNDIVKRQAEVSLLRDEARLLARQLGWEDEDEDTLERRITTELQRAELREVVNTHVRIKEAVRSAAESATLKDRELEELDQELAAIPELEPPAALAPAHARACDFGDANAQAKRLHQAVAQAQQRLDRALQELSPWSGSADDLRALRLPGESAAEEQRLAEETARRRLEGLRERVAGLRREIEVQELEERQIRRDRNPPAADDIVAARQGRNGLWIRIRAGEAAIAAAGDEYERRVADADALADRRWLSAADVQRLEAVRNAIEQRQLELRRCAADAEAVEAELAAAASAWASTLPAELAGLSPSALPAWAQRRRHTLEAADQLAAAASEVGVFEHGLAGLTAVLRGALAETGHDPRLVQALGLRELVTASSAITTEAEAARVRRSGLLRQRARAASALRELQRKVAAAQDEAAGWAVRWADRLANAHLPADLPPGAASEAIALQARLAGVLEKSRELQRSRIATMQRDLDTFAAEARALCASLAPENTGLAPDEIARRLSRKLDDADRARGFVDRAVHDLAEAGKALQTSQDRKGDAEAALAPLIAQAGAAELEDLRDAVERSDRARALDAAIGGASHLILEGGDGFGIDDLEREVAADDPATIRVRLEELERQRQDARAMRDQCLLAQKDAAAELGQIDGKDAAAEAEAQRQEALAAMAEATERFITVFVAGRLLRWVVERFRAERQDPLLLRASDIFRRLTVDSFEELSVDFEGDTPQLRGRRADHTHVGVDGMSEGTRDQLYLALRLAAIELHLERVPPLPFIADDLFVNFDDGRAAAGLQALAELARRTQVIFLTHHRHLAEIAQEAVGGAIHITEL